ncbi:MAG: pre-peptidase C-terminal domain-containing protein [Planctomycetes bacterium]|nr:pre-peptidase C-terminal domain-containing protein [Planctomycetota bacterium]
MLIRPAAGTLMLGAAASAGFGASPAAPALSSLAAEVACYPSNPTEEQAAFIARWRAVPPTAGASAERFITQPRVWTGDGEIGDAGLARRASLTYSFAKDNTTWGIASINTPGPSDLSAKLIALFGSGNLDLGREHIRQAIAGWRRAAGLTYLEVSDDSSAMDQSTLRVPTRGDIRIGGRGLGIAAFLAYNAFPEAGASAIIGGGDMFINTSFFQASWFNNPANNFRYFRNTVAHEHGHGLGALHTTPCDQTKLMEPAVSLLFDSLQIDEIRAAQRHHGDRFNGNQSATTAHDLGELASPGARSVREALLSTNGAVPGSPTGEDWFRFTLSSPQPVTITVEPVGGVSNQGFQVTDCEGAGFAPVNAQIAGNLSLELRDGFGISVLQNSGAAPAGFNETITTTLAPGSYTLRVVDIGPNDPANQTVQLYNLLVRVAGQPYPPRAIAGLHKRMWANGRCHFMGNVSSWVNEPGASMVSYDWDLDANGSFETSGPQVFRTYVSNGTIPVTLRVTDSNGLSATDSINVSVYNATTAVSGVSPGVVEQARSTPIVITGTNFKGVVSASQVTVSGTGVSVTGTPVVDALGTTISGLSLVAAPNAAPGARTIGVTNADGLGLPTSNAVSAAILSVVPPTSAPGGFTLIGPAASAVTSGTDVLFEWSPSSGAFSYRMTLALDPGLERVVAQVDTASTAAHAPAGVIEPARVYYWGVTASNPAGVTASTPAIATFSTPSQTPVCPGDFDADLDVDSADLVVFLGVFGRFVEQGEPADLNTDGVVGTADLVIFLADFGLTCP